MRAIRWLCCTLLLLVPSPAAAEWQFKPFIGGTFGGETTYIDTDQGAGDLHRVVGVTTLFIGETFGVEADLGYVSGFFQGDTSPHLVTASSVTTLTGNVVIALPRRLAQYSLRPYFVGGAGMMHAQSDSFLGPLSLSSSQPAMDLGGGATGFLTNRFGLNWDVRYFRSLGNKEGTGGSIGPEQLSFWRASMALAIKYWREPGEGAARDRWPFTALEGVLMTRRVWLWSIVGVLASGALVGAQEGLRIVPIVSKDAVVVSFDGADTYTEDVRAAISSGLRTTFTYEVELRMLVPAWVDRTIATSVVSVSDQYDNLTRRHSLSRTIDGRVEQASVTEDESVVKQWLTSFSRLTLTQTSKLDQNRDYYVRVRARIRPHGTSLLGWTTAISGQAKFTFVP